MGLTLHIPDWLFWTAIVPLGLVILAMAWCGFRVLKAAWEGFDFWR